MYSIISQFILNWIFLSEIAVEFHWWTFSLYRDNHMKFYFRSNNRVYDTNWFSNIKSYSNNKYNLVVMYTILNVLHVFYVLAVPIVF